MMRRMWLAPLLVTGLLTGMAAAQEADAFKELKPADGKFSVLLPGEPKAQVIKAGAQDVYVYVLQKEPLLYVIGYGDYTEETLKEKGADAFLDADRDSFVKSVKGKIVSEKKVMLDGHPGRDVRVEAPNAVEFQLREFLVGRRLFQVVSGGPKDAIDSEPAKRFHTSFKLLK